MADEARGSTRSDGYEIIGPFESHRVLVGGRRVPFLAAYPMNGGKIALLLDNRYSADVSVADADALIPFIANCIAVAMGYACHPCGDKEPVRLTPFARSISIDRLYVEPGDA